jgi:hypothetical protein
MKKLCFSLLLSLFFIANISAQNEELEAIQRAVDTLYSSLSFEEGGQPDTALFLSIFVNEGILINNNGGKPRIISPKAFVERLTQMSGIKKFNEHEIRGETQYFGTIAQRFSTYDKHIELEERTVKGKGINSFQLVKVNGRWKVSAIIWNDETEKLTIPEAYR